MKITIIGTGYVGLVSGTCFAEFGVEVVCVDKNKKKINNLKKGIIPIFEPGLDKIIERCRGENLHFSSKYNYKYITK